MTPVILVVGSYLIGSIPSAYLVARARTGRDIRGVGSGNVGATNVLRAVGWLPAVIVLALDLGKGVIPVLLGRQLGGSPTLLGTMALAAVAGHVFPFALGFRGGKGVATASGAFASLSPLPALGAFGIFVLIVAWKRYVSLGSVAAASSYPLFLIVLARAGWITGVDVGLVLCTIATSSLIIVKHRSNLRRIRDGEEHKLGERLEVGAS